MEGEGGREGGRVRWVEGEGGREGGRCECGGSGMCGEERELCK